MFGTSFDLCLWVREADRLRSKLPNYEEGVGACPAGDRFDLAHT